MKASEIRKEAREALKGKWGKSLCIILAYILISYALVFPGIFSIILSIPLSFGLVISFIKLKRGENIDVFRFLKEGFYRFGKSWGIAWHTFLRLLLPLLCGLIIFLIIPLILSFIAYSTNTDLSMAPALSMAGLIILVFSLPILAIWIYPKSLLYVLAHNICYDNPELSSKECVLKSAELMKGNRVKYFKLSLSFIGWYFLIYIVYSIVVSVSFELLGVQMIAGNVGQIGNQIGLLLGYLIMVPGISLLISYMRVSTICFYDKLVEKNN